MSGRGINAFLTRMGRLNRTGVFLGTLLLVLAALFTPGWVGVFLLVLLAAAMVGVLALAWPALGPADRRRRVLITIVLLAVMVFAAVRKLA